MKSLITIGIIIFPFLLSSCSKKEDDTDLIGSYHATTQTFQPACLDRDILITVDQMVQSGKAKNPADQKFIGLMEMGFCTVANKVEVVKVENYRSMKSGDKVKMAQVVILGDKTDEPRYVVFGRFSRQ